MFRFYSETIKTTFSFSILGGRLTLGALAQVRHG